MSTRANKLVSLGVATAAVAYGCYPFVSGAGPDSAASLQLPKLTSAMLSPQVPPVGDQDPFRIVRSTTKPPVTVAPPARVVASTPKPAFDPTAILNGLNLESTFLLGSKRLAMIDGHVYAEGAKLAPAKAKNGGELVVARVEMDHVVLRGEGHDLKLHFSSRKTAHAKTRTVARTERRAAPGPKGKEENP